MTDERIADEAAAEAGIPPGRRRVAYGLVALVVVAVAALVYVNVNPRHYLVLMPIAGRQTVRVVSTAIPVVLGIAMLVAARRRSRTRTAGTIVLLLALPMACVWGVDSSADHLDYTSAPPVVIAQSDDGRWEIVTIITSSAGDSDGYLEELWLRSRTGWRSRESPEPLAGGWHDFSTSGPELDVVGATFRDGHAIIVFTSDGKTHHAAFDPATLAVRGWFSLCEPDACS